MKPLRQAWKTAKRAQRLEPIKKFLKTRLSIAAKLNEQETVKEQGNYMNKATIFCDASFKNFESGWGAWITCGQEKLIRMGSYKGHYNSNEAEFYGCFRSIMATISEFKSLEEITIISDSFCVVDQLKAEHRNKPCSNPNIQALKEHILKVLSSHQIELKTVHIKGHQKVTCEASMKNNEVDRLSKFGREQLSA